MFAAIAEVFVREAVWFEQPECRRTTSGLSDSFGSEGMSYFSFQATPLSREIELVQNFCWKKSVVDHSSHRAKVKSSFESGQTLRQHVGTKKPPKRQNVLDVAS